MCVRTMPPHGVPLDLCRIKTYAFVGRIASFFDFNSLFAPCDNLGDILHVLRLVRTTRVSVPQRLVRSWRFVSHRVSLWCVFFSSLFSRWIIDMLFGSVDAHTPLRSLMTNLSPAFVVVDWVAGFNLNHRKLLGTVWQR